MSASESQLMSAAAVEENAGRRITKARFAPLTPLPAQAGPAGMERVSDVVIKIRAELGRTHLTVREILDLAEGSVIGLDKLAGDRIELYANDNLLARGEVVVINDTFTIRISRFENGDRDEER